MRKLLICTSLGTFSAFHYIFYLYLRSYNSRTIQDINFKFSAFLSFVEATKCVKFQSARCTSVKVDIFRISPISVSIGINAKCRLCTVTRMTSDALFFKTDFNSSSVMLPSLILRWFVSKNCLLCCAEYQRQTHI